MKIPHNVPNGYSWLGFNFYHNECVENLIRYAHQSELPTDPVVIISKIKDFYKSHTWIQDTALGFCLDYILEHPGIHHMLKEVNDGSYRKNRIFLNSNQPHLSSFDNHDHERFLEALSNGVTGCYSRNLTKRSEVIESLEEIIDEDKVIFVQFSSLNLYKN